MLGYGLIAGLRFDEMQRMVPGLVMDLYLYRMRYDDQQHGIKRSTEQYEED